MFLISALAQHTRNLEADNRASVLIDQRGETDADQTAARVTLVGAAHRLDASAAEVAKQRMLARHPAAERYISFSDFSLWSLAIERAHLVAGFGRICEIPGADVTLGPQADVVGSAEWELSRRLNAYCDDLWRSSNKPVPRVLGLDCEGLDLIVNDRKVRLDFTSACPTLTAVEAAANARLRDALLHP